MKTIGRIAVLTWIVMTAGACALPLEKGDPGYVALQPFVSHELGIRGVVPRACSPLNPGVFDCENLTPDPVPASLVQMSFPDLVDRDHAPALAGVHLERLPDSSATYRGRALTWDTYTGQGAIGDRNSKTWRTDLGLAQHGSNVYLVALITPSSAYQAHSRLYDTVFTRALYNLEPAG